MVETVPPETKGEIKHATARLGEKPGYINVGMGDSFKRDAAAAGVELVRIDSSLSMDNIFIIRAKVAPRRPGP